MTDALWSHLECLVDEFGEPAVRAYAAFLKDKLAQKDWTAKNPCSRPSARVDAVWHAHMLLPRRYYDMCLSVYDEILVHDPATAHQPERARRYRETRERIWANCDKEAARTFDQTWPDEKDDGDKVKRPKLSAKTFFVQSLTGQKSEHTFDPAQTLQQLAADIETQRNVPAAQCRFTYKGAQLDFGRTLADYNVMPGETIFLVLQLRGC